MIKTLRTTVVSLLLAVLILSQHSYSFQHSWRPRCLQRILTLSKLAAIVGGDEPTPITSDISPTKKALLENNDDDNEIERQMRLEDELELQADVPTEDEDVDINLVESDMDLSISFAIKNMLDEGPKMPELTPVEKFDKLYKDMKSRDKSATGATTLDSAAMLADLFSDSQKKDPFDERKVMMKLRKMLQTEDFTELFKDPNIGDFL